MCPFPWSKRCGVAGRRSLQMWAAPQNYALMMKLDLSRPRPRYRYLAMPWNGPGSAATIGRAWDRRRAREPKNIFQRTLLGSFANDYKCALAPPKPSPSMITC